MTQDKTPSSTECISKVGELIADFEVAMLTTLDDEGRLHSRPMEPLDTGFDGSLWFFTSRTSGKVLSISHDDRVNVAFCEPKTSKFISLAGTAEMISDPEKIKALWKPVYRAWFPKGLEDPDLSLLKVNVESAEYWDPVSSNVVQVLGFAKAVLTGKPFEGTDNHRFSLRH